MSPESSKIVKNRIHIVDHNILIDIEKSSTIGILMKGIIDANPESFCIVNIGASELRLGGVRPDRYDLFEKFLQKINLDHIQRLNPLGLAGITFVNKCNVCSDKDAGLYKEMKEELFPGGYTMGKNLIEQPPFSPIERKRLNQICDAVTLWCHVKYQTTSLVTRDTNFHRKAEILRTKYGANIRHPSDFVKK